MYEHYASHLGDDELHCVKVISSKSILKFNLKWWLPLFFSTYIAMCVV